jgi:hypothetical protein
MEYSSWNKDEIARLGQLLSHLFEREWLHECHNEQWTEEEKIFHHVVTWTPFGHYLKMFCKNCN